jgi:hypothetical protein
MNGDEIRLSVTSSEPKKPLVPRRQIGPHAAAAAREIGELE